MQHPFWGDVSYPHPVPQAWLSGAVVVNRQQPPRGTLPDRGYRLTAGDANG